MSTRSAAALLVAWCLGWTGATLAGTNDDPHDWLERMSAAMSQMSYQGTFVYVQGNEVETMRITHVSDEHGVRERLVSMSGAPREVLRDRNGVRWVLGDDRSVLEDPSFGRSFFPELPLDQQQDASASYVFKMGGSERIADHTARNLRVIPKDNYRYGYSLWLEEHSGLLLRWTLMDSDQQPLAKLMFTDIRLGSEVDPDELKPGSQLKKFKTVESGLPSGRKQTRMQPRWLPSRLPPGFRLTDHRFQEPKEGSIYEHLVYSDGLAAVSVYVENDSDLAEQESGISHLGTTHAFSRTLDGMAVTVVGDVPAITVEYIGNAVAQVSP
ncbi:MAG: MucB/RseB C-terminal domain-containing protein [Planctomycetes bacterium]|nr:MucB/RseB C-terminal domain-containing protein [Planctomycetota bacterium]